jgi:hypothetical protein
MSHDIMPSARLAAVRAAYGMAVRADSYEAREELADLLKAGALGLGGTQWTRARVERHTQNLARHAMMKKASSSRG